MFLRTDSRNNFASWKKDVVLHFRFDVGKDHFGWAQMKMAPIPPWNWGHCCQLSLEFLFEESRVVLHDRGLESRKGARFSRGHRG